MAALLLSAGGATGWAQEAALPDSGVASDSAPVPRKKGLFGKVKDVAGNKVVKTVAKAAVCTMVPGGQVIAGAIDAAGSGSAGEAASGVASAATGTSCMPGLAGGAGMGGGLGGSALDAGIGSAMPSDGEPAEEPAAEPMGYGPMGAMPGEDEMAACLGLAPEELRAFIDPTGGQPRQPTDAELKRQRKLSKNVDMERYQGCMPGAAPQGAR